MVNVLISRPAHGSWPRRATAMGWGLVEVLVVVGILMLLLAIVCSAYLQVFKHAKQKADGLSVPEPRSQVAPDEMHCSPGRCGATPTLAHLDAAPFRAVYFSPQVRPGSAR